MALVDPAQNLDGLPDLNAQGLAKPSQRSRQLFEALRGEGPLSSGGVRLGPEPGLDDVQGQHRPGFGGQGQGAVVGDAQVALEPDHLQGTLHRDLPGSSTAGICLRKAKKPALAWGQKRESQARRTWMSRRPSASSVRAALARASAVGPTGA